jgi:WD40 repeat protein
MVTQAPTRERRWGLLALAEYQLGRQAEALATIQRARAMLSTELGLDPGPELLELERSILQQDPALVAKTSPTEPLAASPYLGLIAYDVGDSAAFFGREQDVTACLRRLDDAGVLSVVGPSGCGKSSVVRAGVAAALERDGNRVVVVTPGRDLADALAQAPRGRNAVFVVDQCEEALAYPATSPDRVAFFAGLVEFAERGQLVLSLRADRLGELSAHPDFAHLVESGLYLLGAMSEEQLRSAIEGPARQAGLRLEPGLVDLLGNEVRGRPATLPLLSHVLRQTWRRREGDTLTVAGYAATGGVQRAVAQSAEQLYGELTPAQQMVVRELMVRLVSPDELGEPVPARVPRQTVSSDEEHTAVVERLVGARLLSTDGESVEIAHESLARAWPRLRSWLDDDVEGLRIMRHLAVAATNWDALGRPDSELYRGARQAKAAEWHASAQANLTETELDYLAASAELAESEQRATEEQVRRERRANQRLRTGLAAVAVLLAVAIVAGALAKTSADRADQQSLAADARRLGAEALRTQELDRAILLAVAGTRLDDSLDTRNNLASVLDRAPELVGVVRVASPNFVSVRPDGGAVAVGGNFTGVTLFDADAHTELARNHQVPVRAVRFNPDGRQLAASVNPFMLTGERRVDPVPLRILDPVTAAPAATQLVGAPKGRVVHQSFAFSDNGRWLAAGFIHPTQQDTDTGFVVWDTHDLTRPVASFTTRFIAHFVAVSDNGRRVYASSQLGLVHALDVASGRQVASAPVEGDTLALSPDGSTLVVNRGRQVALLDRVRLTVQSVFDEDEGVGPIEFSPKGDLLGYTAGEALVVRRMADPAADAMRFTGAGSGDLGFSPDGRTAYSTYGGGDFLLAWDVVGDRRLVKSVPVHALPSSVEIFYPRVSPDGRSVANLVMNGEEAFAVQILDLKTGERTPLPRLRPSGYFADLAWRPDSQMAASVQGGQWVDLWDRDTGRLAAQHAVPERYGALDSVAFSGDGARVVVGTHKGWVHSIDLASMKPVGKPVLVKAQVPVAYSAANRDGSRALAWVGDRVHLLDLVVGSVLRSVDVGFDVEALGWSPDGQSVIVSGSDVTGDGATTVAFLDPETLATLERSSGAHTAGGGYIQFSLDGARFVTAGSGRVALWDARAREFLGSVGRDGDGGAGFARSGAQVLVASKSGAVSAWDPRPGAAVEAACRIAGRELTAAEWRTYLPNREPEPVCP